MPPDFDKNLAPPVFNPFFGMPPPGIPHFIPPVPLDSLGLPHPLAGLHMPPGLPPFQPDVSTSLYLISLNSSPPRIITPKVVDTMFLSPKIDKIFLENCPRN